MAIGDRYAQLSELKDRLKIDVGDTSRDTALQAALSVASRKIEGHCNRQFNDAGTTSARKYFPSSPYVVDVDDFSTLDGMSLVVNGSLFVQDVQWTAYPLNGLNNGMPWVYEKVLAIAGNTFVPLIQGQPNITVTARWGWTAVPDPVHEACLIIAEKIQLLADVPLGEGGDKQFGTYDVKQDSMVCGMLMQYVDDPILVA